MMVARTPVGSHHHLRPLLRPLVTRHEQLVALIQEVAAKHPHHALRMLQLCGVRRYQHIQRGVHPEVCQPVMAEADELVEETLRRILRIDADEVGSEPYIHAMERAMAPIRFGGLQLPRMQNEIELAHVASYATAAPPVLDRMLGLPESAAARRAVALIRACHVDSQWGESYRAALSVVESWSTLSETDIMHLCTTVAPSRNPRLKLGADMHPIVRAEDRALYEVAVPAPEDVSHRTLPGLQCTLSRIIHAGKTLQMVKGCILHGRQPRAARILGTSASGMAFAVSDKPEIYGTPP